MNYGFGQALLDSLVGIMVVFFALILLMCIIKIMTAIGDSREKKNAAAAVGLDFGANVLIALTGKHVLHGLRADELAGRRNERRIAHVLADARGLKQRLIEFVDLAEHFQLAQEVREHAAGDLIGQALGVRGHGDRKSSCRERVLRLV